MILMSESSDLRDDADARKMLHGVCGYSTSHSLSDVVRW